MILRFNLQSISFLVNSSINNNLFIPPAPITGKYPWTSWPKGTYGIPMADSGCPEDRNFRWETGSYVQDTEEDNNENEASDLLHLMGSVNNSKKVSDLFLFLFVLNLTKIGVLPSEVYW